MKIKKVVLALMPFGVAIGVVIAGVPSTSAVQQQGYFRANNAPTNPCNSAPVAATCSPTNTGLICTVGTGENAHTSGCETLLRMP